MHCRTGIDFRKRQVTLRKQDDQLDRFSLPAAPSGFSLIELMITIAIFAILASIAVPSGISWRNNAQFNAAVREVKGGIENARMAAIRSNLRARVQFVDGTNGFTIEQLDRTGTWRVSKTVQLGVGVQLSSNFNADRLVLNNRGMVVPPTGTVRIQSAQGICRQITVSSVGSSRVARCP